MSVILLLSLLALAFGRLEIGNIDLPHMPDEYIITYHTNTTHEEAERHWGLMETAGVSFIHKYSIKLFSGFAAKITDKKVLDALLEDPLVLAVEANGFAYAIGTQQGHDCSRLQTGSPSWGLDRVCHKGTVENGVKGEYRYSSSHTGQGSEVFVIDTGIYVEHNDFGGRAKWGIAYADGGTHVDGNGHGTHCAGTIGGTLHGVAKDVTLIAVKVLGASGGGTWADVTAGVTYCTRGVPNKCVASMSLGGAGSNTALTNAVNALVAHGCCVVVAAGNSNGNACSYTPSGIPSTICVAASEIAGFAPQEFDSRASFSNYGTCVDIIAPGRDITSAWIGNPNAINTISGTSMACPHVAGFAAGIQSAAGSGGASPDQVLSTLQETSQRDLVQNAGTGTPNLLLHNTCQS